MDVTNLDHEKILEEAFSNSKNTAVEFPPADVNDIILRKYNVDKPFTYTRTQLWDMELRKASRPDIFLGPLVKPGSLEVFPSTRRGNLEDFTRITQQRRWKDPSRFTTVIEHVRIDHDAHRIFFIGDKEFVAPDGRKFTAGPDQALFHVEHSTTGPEEKPLNLWRIVNLTGGRDEELLKVLDGMSKDPYLPPFNEVYIREVMGLKLERK
ncbi:hypothetical protein NA57DRAFT_56534 [Rhizodiscina lignyota]|uniref:Uncharacterized protein n=1 Tax=Rhizodiscina lignyota TaxID=1504668 RepID=A0A9P4IIP5_9PEZI|nr:hypothetical protein NA57DRAFT_56534 [Rhizodiscina lignyota]